MTHAPHDLAGAYALDALPDTESRRFERHLADCPGCRDETVSLRETAARLAVAAAQEPPPGLHARVLDQIGRTRQRPPPLIHRIPAPGRGGDARLRARGGLTWLAAAACLIVAVIVGAQAVQRHNDAEHAQARNRQISSILAAPDARTNTARTPGGATLTAVTSQNLDKAVITAGRLQALPAARTYQFWFLGTVPPRSAGLLEPSAGGDPPPLIAAPLRDARRIAVTIEPAGGSPGPTTDPILTVGICSPNGGATRPC